MPRTMTLYPLKFEPIYKEKVWGGRALERLGRVLPGGPATPIGESWELVDLPITSASGGGGGAEHSVVSNGPLAGTPINQLLTEYGTVILGKSVSNNTARFPLLIKYLDAHENLSVQVHPSPQYAAAHPEAHLKSEAWYVVDCSPGAVIYKGLKPGTTPEQLRAAIEANTDDAVVPLLNAVPVKPGDCHYLPSGTLHALGAGVLVAEVQTPSDTTFRVYDWGRTDRELHIEQAMACIDLSPAPLEQTPPPRIYEGSTTYRKASCDYFMIHEVAYGRAGAANYLMDGLEVWMGLEGTLDVFTETMEPTRLEAGRTLLVPGYFNMMRIETHGPGRWLRVRLPLPK